MFEQVTEFISANFFLRTTLLFFLAWIVSRLSRRIAGRVLRLSRFTSERRRPSPEREQTLQELLANIITVLAFLVVILASLLFFIDVDTLFWMIGLFSAAFGLGARPQISDFLSGLGFLFEDTFSVGEKVEIMGNEGVIEAVKLRTVLMRAPTGELFVIPNGEIRVVRNFSRGKFSAVNVTLKVSTASLNRTLETLSSLSADALVSLPNLIEDWQVLNETGAVGEHTELSLIAHARFGKGAEMRPRLLALIHERLAEEGIELVD